MDFKAGNLLVSVIPTSLFGRNLSVEGINGLGSVTQPP